jgi:hypothetical protein
MRGACRQSDVSRKLREEIQSRLLKTLFGYVNEVSNTTGEKVSREDQWVGVAMFFADQVHCLARDAGHVDAILNGIGDAVKARMAQEQADRDKAAQEWAKAFRHKADQR